MEMIPYVSAFFFLNVLLKYVMISGAKGILPLISCYLFTSM